MAVLLTEAGDQINSEDVWDLVTEDHAMTIDAVMVADCGGLTAVIVVPVPEVRRTNFAMTGWYFTLQEPWQDVVDFAEGRTDDLFV